MSYDENRFKKHRFLERVKAKGYEWEEPNHNQYEVDHLVDNCVVLHVINFGSEDIKYDLGIYSMYSSMGGKLRDNDEALYELDKMVLNYEGRLVSGGRNKDIFTQAKLSKDFSTEEISNIFEVFDSVLSAMSPNSINYIMGR